MDNASKNAKDMIGSLTMQYNRGRQAAITNELVDIITGALQTFYPCSCGGGPGLTWLDPQQVQVLYEIIILLGMHTCATLSCRPR